MPAGLHDTCPHVLPSASDPMPMPSTVNGFNPLVSDAAQAEDAGCMAATPAPRPRRRFLVLFH